jgi:hypothetical protein
MKFISITPENNNASDFFDITNTIPSFVKLYSPSCGHCIAMQEDWDNLKNNPELKNYNMAVIEVHADELDNINSPAVSVNGGFPTIRKVLKSGKLGKDYNGDRSTKDMIKFIKDEFKETLTNGKSHTSKHKVHKKMKGGKQSMKKKNETRRSKQRKSKQRKSKQRKSKLHSKIIR